MALEPTYQAAGLNSGMDPITILRHGANDPDLRPYTRNKARRLLNEALVASGLPPEPLIEEEVPELRPRVLPPEPKQTPPLEVKPEGLGAMARRMMLDQATPLTYRRGPAEKP
jgi:hypothetical protein